MSYKKEYEKVYAASILFALLVLGANVYYFCRPVLERVGLVHGVLDYVILRFRSGGAFSSPYPTKLAAFLLLVLSTIVRSGKGRNTDMRVIVALTAVSCTVYFLPWFSPGTYLLSTVAGTAGVLLSSSLISRLYGGIHPHDNNLLESFEQESVPYVTPCSVNIPMEYYWKKRWREGWVSVVNVYRGSIVIGLPGCGKSASVINPYISQLIAKGFTMMLYDFKMPDLSLVVYNELLRNRDKYRVQPRFCCIDFKDPRKSNRCNPIAPRYFTDIVDANETARVVMSALNKGNDKKDFFTDSAQQYFGTCLWELVTYTPPGGRRGDWCDFPHLIELINQDYKKVLGIIRRNRDLDSKAKVFIDAMDAQAQDQLQGQIASVRIPLNDIASPLLYWVLSGDDFSLDINNPEEPKIVCLGNDPKRQEVYGAALSLFTFRIIKLVNEKGKLPCALVVDELPTIKVEGLDGLMATARSNRVAVVLGIQDVSQLVADYGEKAADKVMSLPANVFVGQVNGKTAERFSKEFGREFRRQESETVSIESQSTSVSYHEEEVMPVRKIATLSSGTFFGRVAVDHDSDMKQNFFCARMKMTPMKGEVQPMPDLTDFGLDSVRRSLDDPDTADEYIMDELRAKVEKEWRTPGTDGLGKELPLRGHGYDEMEDEVERRFHAMDGDDRRRLLDSILPRLEEEHIRRVMEENASRIKADIQMMIDTLSASEDEVSDDIYSEDENQNGYGKNRDY